MIPKMKTRILVRVCLLVCYHFLWLNKIFIETRSDYRKTKMMKTKNDNRKTKMMETKNEYRETTEKLEWWKLKMIREKLNKN